MIKVEVSVGKQRARAELYTNNDVRVSLLKPGVWLSAGVGTWDGERIVGLAARLPDGVQLALEEALRRKAKEQDG